MNGLEYIYLDDETDLSNLDFKDDFGEDSEKLQWYVRNRAHKYHKSNFALTYVIRYNQTNIGYITVAASSIPKKEIEEKKGVQADPHLPSIIVVNFAVDREFRRNQKGLKVGTTSMLWIYALARKIAKDVGCRYITLYAKNAIGFYEKNGYKKTGKKTSDGFALMYKDLFPELEQ